MILKMTTKHLLVAVLQALAVLPSLGNAFNESCYASSCMRGVPSYCYCDSSCIVYGDCCHDANVTTKPPLDPKFSCLGLGKIFTRFWMITTCSRSWIAEQLADGVINVNDVVSSCEDPSVRASFSFLPPVTDKRTGTVYQNHFCARCNGLQLPDVARWSIQLNCNKSLVLNSQRNLAFSNIEQFCDYDVYKPPTSFPMPRKCPILPDGLISSCPGSAPVDLQEQCSSGGLNVVETEFGSSNYVNGFCAACHNVNSSLEGYNCRLPLNGADLGPGPNSLVILLDISDTGTVAATSAEVSSATFNVVEEVCPNGSVYDVFRGSCRMLPSANCTNSTAITLEGGSYSLKGNDSVFWISYNLNVSIESVNTNGRPLVCIPSVENATCVPIILESNEYTQQDNNSRMLVLVSGGERYVIEGYDPEGRPLICSNFTQTRKRAASPNHFQYPQAFGILTYIGLTIDFVSGSLFVVTFLLFKELRTFFSKLMVNFMVSILLGDIIFLLGGPLLAYLNAPPLCIAVGILLHYVFLCRFGWMTVMGSELVRSFNNMRKLNKIAAENWKLLSLYMLVGWLSPLVIVIPTVIVNFTVDNSVNYGVGNSCWINGAIALIVTFAVPVGVSIVYNTIAFIVVIMLVACIRNQPLVTSFHPKEYRKQLWKDVRFALAVFTLTGLSWLFGFLALLSRILSWAWYLFIIFSSTQALAVSVAFLFTMKVFRLYRSLLCCIPKTKDAKVNTASKPHMGSRL